MMVLQTCISTCFALMTVWVGVSLAACTTYGGGPEFLTDKRPQSELVTTTSSPGPSDQPSADAEETDDQWSATDTHRSTQGDAGARRLVRAMRRAVHPDDEAASQSTFIAVNVRNMSHARSGEFDRAMNRLVDELNAADSTSQFLFQLESDEPHTLDLKGSAYLMPVKGFDQWEIYLELSRAEDDLQLWRTRWPVRMLRQSVPDAPVIEYPCTLRK